MPAQDKHFSLRLATNESGAIRGAAAGDERKQPRSGSADLMNIEGQKYGIPSYVFRYSVLISQVYVTSYNCSNPPLLPRGLLAVCASSHLSGMGDSSRGGIPARIVRWVTEIHTGRAKEAEKERTAHVSLPRFLMLSFTFPIISLAYLVGPFIHMYHPRVHYSITLCFCF